MKFRPNNGKRMLPQGQTQAANNIRVDLSTLEAARCKNCGGVGFVMVHQKKFLGRVQSPTGKPQWIMVPIGEACPECGAVNQFPSLEEMERGENGPVPTTEEGATAHP